MTSVNGVPVLHLAGVLGLLMKRLRADMAVTVQAAFPDLRVSHLRLLEMIPVEGARITDLAEVAGMTKQGLGQHVDYLQRHGYVVSKRLAEDKRVRLVVRTARGDEAVQVSTDAIARVEERWRDELGPERYEEFVAIAKTLGLSDQPAR